MSWVLSAISISAKMIAAQVRRARLEDVLGSAGAENVQGETQQKLDVIANDILMRNLGGRQGVAIVASEENEQPVILRDENDGETRYCVMFDPLDGSSNLDIAGGVGTIFSILRKDRRSSKIEDSLLQPGTRQVAAGYVLYGSSTVMVLTIGDGVDMFVLDPSIGAFIRVAEKMQIPARAEVLLDERGQPADAARGLPALPALGAGAGLLQPLHRRDGGRRAPHPDPGWRVPVPADEEGPEGQAATDVRGQPDGDAGGAGGRQGAGSARAAHPGCESRPRSTSAPCVILGSREEVDLVMAQL